MSLFLHLSSALVFLVLLYLLRRLFHERDFLCALLKTQRSGEKLCLCPLVFVRRFATLCEIELHVQRAVPLPPVLVDVRGFLDFYRQYGIQSMRVCPCRGGGCVLTIKTETPATGSFPAGVFGKMLAVEVNG